MQLAPSALHATAETLTGYLGTDTWHVNELIIDDIISLEGPHNRQLGMRLLGNGSSIQLWATGGTETADHEPIEGTVPLPLGRRWHTAVHIGRLEADKDPAVVLYNAISDRLLPPSTPSPSTSATGPGTLRPNPNPNPNPNPRPRPRPPPR